MELGKLVALCSRAALVSVVPLLACGAGQKTATAETPESHEESAPKTLVSAGFLVPGESMRFELSLRGLVGGESTLATGQPGVVDGRNVVITRSRTETVGLVAAIKEVRDDVITHIEVASGKPVYHHADVKFGDREAIIESTFEGAGAAVKYNRKGMSQRDYRLRLPAGETMFEAHSIVASLRAWQPEPGARAHFHILSGRRIWRNDVTMTKREKVTTALGTFDAIRIDGVATRLLGSMRPDPRKKPRQFSIWISDDGSRRPLLVSGRTEYGVAQAELIEYYAPDGRLVSR